MNDNHWLIANELKPSAIHGTGRFALGEIAAGQTVLILAGTIAPKTGKHIPIKDTDYCIICPPTYINHSADPNLMLDGQIVFKASRRIAAGEELLLDYSTLTSSKLEFI